MRHRWSAVLFGLKPQPFIGYVAEVPVFTLECALSRTRQGPEVPSLRLRLIYFAPADVQVARVDRNCIVKFCEAMAENRSEVTLVSMRVKVLDTEPSARMTFWDVFGVKTKFALASVRTPLRQIQSGTPWGHLVVKIARATAYPTLAVSVLLRERRMVRTTVLYCKNLGMVPGLVLARRVCRKRALIIFEAHRPPRTAFQRWAVRRVDGIVCNGQAVRRRLLTEGLAKPERCFAVHQGCDLQTYPPGSHEEARKNARRRLGWEETDSIAVYTGKVYWPYKEVDFLLRAAAELTEDSMRLVVVGGRADHVQRWRDEALARGLDNVHFVGFVAPSEVADYQVGADALISYYPSGIELNDYRSPGKMFEYMASGAPIVAADYPALREVLRHEDNALLVEPDQPEVLAMGLRRLVRDPLLSARLGSRAQNDAAQYTWAARAEAISAFVDSLERA